MAKRKLPRIGVDVDGVLADFASHMIRHMNQMFVGTWTMNDVTTFHLDSLIPEDRRAEFWKSFGEDIDLHDHLECLPGAEDGIRLLAKSADIYIVTSHLKTAPHWVYERDLWLERKFGIHPHKIIHTHAKYTFFGKMLVDDKLENISARHEEHPSGCPVLWKQPWNAEGVQGALRTNSWEEVAGICESM